MEHISYIKKYSGRQSQCSLRSLRLVSLGDEGRGSILSERQTLLQLLQQKVGETDETAFIATNENN